MKNAEVIHQVSVPFNTDVNFTGLARSVDVHLPKPLAKQLGPPRKEKLLNRKKRVERILSEFELKDDVILKIASLGWDGVKRLSNTIEAINDNLITSSPDMIRSYREMPAYKKLIRWSYAAAVHNSDHVTKQWKKFAALLKWRALQSETEAPEKPTDFPGFGSQLDYLAGLPHLWQSLCPWLKAVWERGLVGKVEATRLQHLVTSRNFPAGGKATRNQSLIDHWNTLHSAEPPSLTATRLEILERISYMVGRTVKTHLAERHRSAGHLSLTSSASIDSSVKEGGRAAEVGAKYRAWAAEVAAESVSKETWFGEPYRLIAGRPRWMTMCRENPEEYIEGHESFDDFAPNMVPGESAENMFLDFENFRYEDPLYGLDEVTGKQLLQWSIEEGIRQGILSGSPYKSGDRLRLTGCVPSIRASAIGEPGAKSRVVTVGEDWLTVLLQPWSHDIIGELRAHPSAKTGLTRGWQLYEWVKALRNAGPPPQGDRYFLSSDLKTATDFCCHSSSRAMLRGLHQGLGKQDSKSWRYMQICMQLLCFPRVYETNPAAIDRGVGLSDGEGSFQSVTSRGILMGDPGAKIVLTMHNLCAEYEAILRTQFPFECSDGFFLEALRSAKGPAPNRWRHFACSGDDHFGQGPKSYLQRITLNHELNGMSVSRPQNFLSSRGGFYCEELLLTVGLRDDQVWGGNTALRDKRYEEQPHIDSMKIRLFSPCSKEHEGKDEPNPAIGKARQVHGMLAWLGGGWEEAKPLFSARWGQRLEAFLPKHLEFRYLPVRLGGIEAPAFHLSITEMKDILRAMSPEHLWAVSKVIDGTASAYISRVLATFATNARARGVSSDAIEDNIKEVLSNADLVHGVYDSDLQLLAGVSDLDWRDLRFKDKQVIAKRHGFITIDDAVTALGRPYTFRDMLYPEMSLKHGINPYKTEAYENVPWERREVKFLENLLQVLPPEYQKISDTEAEVVIDKISHWAVNNEPLELPRQVYFLPESVVVSKTLCTLRTPLQ